MGDVAAAAGVSAQTVSRVVNASPRVDPATRARVEDAMALLGYQVNRAARALRTGRSHTIGVVVATLASVGNSRMLEAVAASAARRGFALTVVTLAGSDGVADAFAQLHEQGVDGAIVLNEATAIAGDAPVPAGLRIVAVDAPRPRESDDAATPFPTVQSDHAGGAAAATAHLLGRGHATVFHLAGPTTSFAAGERERGWRETLAAAGAPAPDPLRGDWTAASGFAAGARLAALPGVTAVFAANDQMALGLVRALSEAGRTVGDDVLVVGFDDVADAADFRPPLTTVRQDFDALGEAAVTSLVAAIGGAAPAHVTLPATLVRRASA
ncbi:MAG: LacI family DNA-binding transcriptional regulator [Candidatus Microbacterium phytovorans]|uniref:LacI family DNA-binding transcriptional regulator n=1 Tax=Candidatus Microbacterium phytovorans TaxID=3121374 RepID=A0AAJ5W3B3_9MICO|nr:LacI family DNA-binding transcriptional regulator [Microbacterium sp.]WEK15054.1 MAG: LacI family DNA-binding transcriptional regulator [Microbacterium sp.]